MRCEGGVLCRNQRATTAGYPRWSNPNTQGSEWPSMLIPLTRYVRVVFGRAPLTLVRMYLYRELCLLSSVNISCFQNGRLLPENRKVSGAPDRPRGAGAGAHPRWAVRTLGQQ